MWLHGIVNCSPYMPVAVGRQDYAINGGDYFTSSGVIGTTMVGAKWAGDWAWGGPSSPGQRRRAPLFAATTHPGQGNLHPGRPGRHRRVLLRQPDQTVRHHQRDQPDLSSR